MKKMVVSKDIVENLSLIKLLTNKWNINGAIEAYFNQIKHYLKLNKKVLKFNELKEETKKAINKVSKENYKNYFNYAYKKENLRKYKKGISTLRRKPKNYKKSNN